MTAKTSDWRPGPTVCRCCLAEGCYKDISTEYFWMGKREVYAELLLDTLDVSIAYSKSGPNSNSRLICEPCISRLRDAHDFKRQVLECEKTFMQHLDPGSSSVQNEVQLTLEEVKVERVKQEKKQSDDEDFDDGIDFVVNDDSDDDLDNEPLVTLASKVPKKEKEVDILDLLDSSQITVKRKATASSSKAKEPPAKKAKKQIVIKPSASKATTSAAKTGEKKKKECRRSQSSERMTTERRNAKIMLKYSTIYPFKVPRGVMTCYYCDEEFEHPPLFRQHMKDTHSSPSTLVQPRVVKVDCTELQCRICSKSFDDVKSLGEHLNIAHKLDLHLNSSLGVVPFVLPNRQWTCALCNAKEPTLRSLCKHMTMNHVSAAVTCEECGRNFADSWSLKKHVDTCHKKILRCVRCRQTFATIEERREHYKVSSWCWRITCHVCNIRFPNDGSKLKHMREEHDIICNTITCSECDKSFSKRRSLFVHFREFHTDDKICCSFCPQVFGDKSKFNRHLITHTKERAFPCPVCDKAFSHAIVLKQHMWNHREEKRFKCQPCNKQFNQKVSWRSHMARYHSERPDDSSGTN